MPGKSFDAFKFHTKNLILKPEFHSSE